MKKSTPPRKLAFASESIRELQLADLRAVAGGDSTTCSPLFSSKEKSQ